MYSSYGQWWTIYLLYLFTVALRGRCRIIIFVTKRSVDRKGVLNEDEVSVS